ncbi:hypothetical protein [uncultured Acinetobacter sp.]|uniref:hypothetical protein n=1 Tax=uncultured Acinetobacter sp. TaxID=165433 RepID=UPI00258781BE|nr:hypothetical protein [uncultured Acinetobacter sp.]
MFDFKNEYTYFGFFYTKDLYGDKKYRKYLDIKKKYSKESSPQMMVIMMNPGASYPLNGNDNQPLAVEAEPDKAQGQIVALMKKCSLEYVRVLNLSDLREPKSEIFYKNIDPQDSIFSPSNKADFEQFFIKSIPVLMACGVHYSLNPLVKLAITAIGNAKIFGLKKENYTNKYYHASPRFKEQRKSWVDNVAKQIINTKVYCP